MAGVERRRVGFSPRESSASQYVESGAKAPRGLKPTLREI